MHLDVMKLVSCCPSNPEPSSCTRNTPYLTTTLLRLYRDGQIRREVGRFAHGTLGTSWSLSGRLGAEARARS